MNNQEILEEHIVIDNIFNCKENILCHQVNMQKRMANGIAKQVKELFPNVYDNYMKANLNLGDVDIVKIHNPKSNLLYIANMYSQFRYGYDGKRYTDYDALRKCFKELAYHITNSNKKQNNFTLAVPYKIGCGLGGGDWNIVSQIIFEELKDIEYKIYKLM